MKKFLVTTLLTLLAMTSFGCWFTEENFNGSYLAGVNGLSRYNEVSNIAEAEYQNGIPVALPMTVYIKVTPHQFESGTTSITSAVLQYKILPSGKWVTVKQLADVSWAMDFPIPVALFGKNCIDIKNIASGTEILIRVHFSAGLFESGDLQSDITDKIPDKATASSGGKYEGGWTAPMVFRVIWNGKRRAK